MSEVELKLSEEQYKTLLRFLYLADYLVWNNLVSDLKDSTDREILTDVIQRIYDLGDKLNLPESASLNTMVSPVRFTEEEEHKLRVSFESDLDNIAKILFANEFAEKDLRLPENDWIFEGMEDPMGKSRAIGEKRQPYLREFNENGITNLRFKMFYHLPSDEDDE